MTTLDLRTVLAEAEIRPQLSPLARQVLESAAPDGVRLKVCGLRDGDRVRFACKELKRSHKKAKTAREEQPVEIAYQALREQYAHVWDVFCVVTEVLAFLAASELDDAARWRVVDEMRRTVDGGSVSQWNRLKNMSLEKIVEKFQENADARARTGAEGWASSWEARLEVLLTAVV
jgi:hypothetical protein